MKIGCTLNFMWVQSGRIDLAILGTFLKSNFEIIDKGLKFVDVMVKGWQNTRNGEIFMIFGKNGNFSPSTITCTNFKPLAIISKFDLKMTTGWLGQLVHSKHT